jgi:hypothetical protein
MGRKYPRFLYSEALNTKSEGPFIIHTLPPRFITKPEFDKQRNLTDFALIDNWDNAETITRWAIQEEMRKWFYFSGRQYSQHPKDKILVQLAACEFIKDYHTNYSVEQAAEIVSICFPTKTKTINDHHSSYGLKHLLERISSIFISINMNRKYCSNDTMKAAFDYHGFKSVADGPNCSYNISEKDFENINELTMQKKDLQC